MVAKYTQERIKLHNFKKNSQGSIPPNPLAYKCFRHALRMAQSAMQIGSLFTNKLEPHPPPPK